MSRMNFRMTIAALIAVGAVLSVQAKDPLRGFMLKLAADVPAGSATFDTNVWNEVTARLAANDINTLVVALEDGVVWPSHPELAAPVAWDVARLKDELARLRKLGLEPIPLVPTRGGIDVMADLVRDAVRLFECPRLVALDAPCAELCDEVLRLGARPLVFARAVRPFPKGTIVANVASRPNGVDLLPDFVAAGFDVVACGSSTSQPQKSMEAAVKRAREKVSDDRLKGFLLISGRETVAEEREELIMAAYRVGEAFATQTVARESPEWFKNAVIYQMQLRGFTPEGTLVTAQKRLAKIRELGFDLVYLCPIWVADDNPDQTKWSGRQKLSKMNNPRNPYIMKDFDHVDPQYGTDDDFKAFVDAAHRLGLRVMVDLVYRHCGWGAGFLKTHKDYAMRNPDGTVRIIDPGFPLPRLNYASRGLRDMLVANMVRMVRDFGVDGFRTDMSDEVPLDFWAEGRVACARYRPDLVMIAEGMGPGNLAKVFDANYAHCSCREGLMPHLYGGLPLPGIFGADAVKDVAKSFRSVFEWETGWLPKGGRLMTFIENHDTAQESYENRAERILGSANQAAGLATLFALPGVPLVYNGQEICDASRLSLLAQPGRNVIDWSRESAPEAQARQALLKRLTTLRHTRPALTSTLIEWLDNDNSKSVISFVRRDGKGDELFFVANLSASAVKVSVDTRGTYELAAWEFRFVE